MRVNRRVFVVVALGLSAAAWGQPAPKHERSQPAHTAAAPPANSSAAAEKRDISGLLKTPREQGDVPGMVGAIIVHDRVVAVGADGVRERGKPELVTTQDKFHLGSDTKAMTATLLAMFVEEGKLKWTSTVGEIFGDVQMDPKWRPVTLEQLLWHRGGAPTNLDGDGLWSRLWKFKGTPTEARMELVRGVLKYPPHPIGTYEYANAGYAMAGAMAERISGKAWEDLMRERLFGPLGMSSAGFGAPGTKEKMDQPRGHHEKGAPVEPGPGADNPVAIGPAGIVHCSIEDWAKFASLHLLGERGPEGGGKLLKAETFKKLHAPAEGEGPKYAMGWGVPKRPWAKGPGGEGRLLHHAGSNTMWFCVAWIAPEKDFAILVACNQGGDKSAKACDEAVQALIKDHEEHDKP